MSLRILLSTQNKIPFVRGCNIWYFVKIKKFYIVPLKFIDIYPSNNTNGSVESNIHYDFLYNGTMEKHKSNDAYPPLIKFFVHNYFDQKGKMLGVKYH